MGTYSPVTRDSDGKTVRLDKQEAEQADIVALAKRVLMVEGYTQRMAYTSQGLPEFIGLATTGSLTSGAVWQIRKLVYSGTNITEIIWADGDLNFDNVWDNHASLSYS